VGYKRKSKHDYGDHDRKHKHLPYGYKGDNTYSSNDRYLIPVVNNTSVRMKSKQAIKRLLNEE
jgi:hypothetical protein